MNDPIALAAAARELIDLCPRIERIMRRFASAQNDGEGLSMPHYRTLRALRRRPRRMSDLTERLMLSKQTVSQSVDALVQRGLATRREDSDDRRHTIVAPSAAGLEHLDAFESDFATYLAGALDGLSSEADGRIVEALARINAQLVRRRDAGYFKALQRQREAVRE